MNNLKQIKKHASKNKLGVTKQFILTISTVMLFILNMNAKTLNATANNDIAKTGITESHIIKIYEWSVKTLSGKSSGTASSLENANEMIVLFSTNEAILEKQITSYYVLTSELKNNSHRIYYWEVQSTNGNAKGYSSSEDNAREIINLVAKGEIISYKIITSEKRK